MNKEGNILYNINGISIPTDISLGSRTDPIVNMVDVYYAVNSSVNLIPEALNGIDHVHTAILKVKINEVSNFKNILGMKIMFIRKNQTSIEQIKDRILSMFTPVLKTKCRLSIPNITTCADKYLCNYPVSIDLSIFIPQG